MNQIAFILGEKFLYWSAIILTLATVSAVLLYLSLSLGDPDTGRAALAAAAMAVGFSILFARLVHWHCRPEVYDSLFTALTDYSRGGFALIGAFFGCVLTAGILRLAHLSRNLPRMLDHMALAGCLGISTGRLASFFNTSDRGMLLPDTVGLPWAVEMTNSVSGLTENRLAVFLLQSMAAAVLFAGLMAFYIRGRKKGNLRDGDTCLVFLLIYCACQVVMDSPRYDNLYFRSNGFVTIVQIFGIMTVVAVACVFLIRLVKTRGKRWAATGLLLLPLFGCAGYMEYHVQRHGEQAALAYSFMGAAMAIAVIRILVIRSFAVPAENTPQTEENHHQETSEKGI